MTPILPTEISRKATKCCTSASESANRTGSPSAVAASTSSALLSGAGPPWACRTSGYLTAPISSCSSMMTSLSSLYIMVYIAASSNGVGAARDAVRMGQKVWLVPSGDLPSSGAARSLFDGFHRDLHVERPRGVGRRGDDHVGARASVVGGVGDIDPSRGGN